jgi:hypothetical protein
MKKYTLIVFLLIIGSLCLMPATAWRKRRHRVPMRTMRASTGITWDLARMPSRPPRASRTSIWTRIYTEEIPRLLSDPVVPGDGSGFTLLAVGAEKKTPYFNEYVEKLSFGNNTAGTCTAVATGQVLNYLDYAVDDNIVPNKYEAG